MLAHLICCTLWGRMAFLCTFFAGQLKVKLPGRPSPPAPSASALSFGWASPLSPYAPRKARRLSARLSGLTQVHGYINSVDLMIEVMKEHQDDMQLQVARLKDSITNFENLMQLSPPGPYQTWLSGIFSHLANILHQQVELAGLQAHFNDATIEVLDALGRSQTLTLQAFVNEQIAGAERHSALADQHHSVLPSELLQSLFKIAEKPEGYIFANQVLQRATLLGECDESSQQLYLGDKTAKVDIHQHHLHVHTLMKATLPDAAVTFVEQWKEHLEGPWNRLVVVFDLDQTIIHHNEVSCGDRDTDDVFYITVQVFCFPPSQTCCSGLGTRTKPWNKEGRPSP